VVDRCGELSTCHRDRSDTPARPHIADKRMKGGTPTTIDLVLLVDCGLLWIALGRPKLGVLVSRLHGCACDYVRDGREVVHT
jgi:hypothetical protein